VSNWGSTLRRCAGGSTQDPKILTIPDATWINKPADTEIKSAA